MQNAWLDGKRLNFPHKKRPNQTKPTKTKTKTQPTKQNTPDKISCSHNSWMELSELPYSIVRRKVLTTKPDLKSNNIEVTFAPYESYSKLYFILLKSEWFLKYDKLQTQISFQRTFTFQKEVEQPK